MAGLSISVQGFRRVACFQGGVAEALDLGNHIFAHQGIVLDDEDDLIPALDPSRMPATRSTV